VGLVRRRETKRRTRSALKKMMTRHDESVSAYEISKVEALNLTYMNRKRAIEKRISICPLKGTRKRSNKELAK